MSLILTITVIISILLILIVLIQKPKGGGIAANFSAGNQIMGVKRTNDFIEKSTWGLAIGLLVLALVASMIGGGSEDSGVQQKSLIQSEIEDGSLNNTIVKPNLNQSKPQENTGGGTTFEPADTTN